MRLTNRIALVVGVTLLGVLAASEWGRVGAVELDGNEDFIPLATEGFRTAVDGEHPE
jgi:hypothetical protein